MSGAEEGPLRARIESPRPGDRVGREAIEVRGWALDELGPLTGAVVLAGAGPARTASLGGARPDVLGAFPEIAHAGASGCEAVVDLRPHSSDGVRIALLVRRADGSWHEADAVEVTLVEAAADRPRARERSLGAPVDGSLQGRIDSPREGDVVPRGAVPVAGWALDEHGPLAGAMIVAGDGSAVRAPVGRWRPDVQESHSAVQHAGASGLEAVVDLRSNDADHVRIALLAQLDDGSWHEADAVDVAVEAPPRERDGARPRAVFTIVQNEPVWLARWLDYYSRHFDADDIYVLDHDSSDGSAAAQSDRCHVIPVHRQAAFDHSWLRATVERFQALLLCSYETVLFAEADEFVVADPITYGGLADYIERMSGSSARCAGFNVVHQPGEPPIRLDQPLLSQRSRWHASGSYSKRLLSRMPLRWSPGFHGELNAPDGPPDPELILVHMHRVDYELCLARHRSTAARDWNERDLAGRMGEQNRISDDGEFERWFSGGEDLEGPAELIPEHLRAAL